MTARIDIPPIDPYDPARSVEQNFAILFEHQRRLTDALTGILRALSGSISEPGGLADVPVARLAELRVAGPPVVVRVPDASGGPTLAFNDGSLWKRVLDGGAVS